MPEQNGVGERKSAGEIADRSRLLRLEIGEPACQTLLGFIGSGQMRPVHETRGQTMSVRVAVADEVMPPSVAHPAFEPQACRRRRPRRDRQRRASGRDARRRA